MHTGRDTQNSSSNLCDYYINLRFEEMFNDMPLLPKLTGFANLNYFSAGNTWAPGSSSQCYLAGSSYDRVEITLQGMSNMSQGNAGWLRIDNVNGYMDFDAEL